MRITIITPVFPYPNRGIFNGIERFVESIAIFFKKIGHHVKIITTYWNGGKRYEIYQGIPILRIMDSKTIFKKMGSVFLLNYFTFGLNIVKKKKNFSFYSDSDVIMLATAIGFSRFLKMKNIPIFSVFHHYDSPRSLSDFLTLPIFHYLEKRQFRKYKHVIAFSSASKNKLVERYKLNKKYISVIPHGVDLVKFNPSNYSEEIRLKFNNNILLYSGHMIRRKKVPILLYAIKYIIKKNPNIHLILLGDGPLLNNFKDLSKKLEIQNNVTFLGFIKEEDIIKFYASSDIYVLPSELEGFGQVLLEAMASGTPVICANKPPMCNIIENGGLTFELNNSKDLSEKILILLKNKEILNSLKKNALLIAKKYSWETIAKKYIDIFK